MKAVIGKAERQWRSSVSGVQQTLEALDTEATTALSESFVKKDEPFCKSAYSACEVKALASKLVLGGVGSLLDEYVTCVQGGKD